MDNLQPDDRLCVHYLYYHWEMCMMNNTPQKHRHMFKTVDTNLVNFTILQVVKDTVGINQFYMLRQNLTRVKFNKFMNKLKLDELVKILRHTGQLPENARAATYLNALFDKYESML